MVRERDLVGMTSAMRVAFLEALDIFARTKDPQYIDLILDKACFYDMVRFQKIGKQFSRRICATIDTNNIKIFARICVREIKLGNNARRHL